MEYLYVIFLDKEQPISQSAELEKLFKLEEILESFSMVSYDCCTVSNWVCLNEKYQPAVIFVSSVSAICVSDDF